jgi:anti-anti-sigma factor
MTDPTSPQDRVAVEVIRRPPDFSLRSTRELDTHTIVPAGELTIATAPDLEAELLRVEATDTAWIVLDLSDLQSIDTTGMSLIVRADARSRAARNRLTLLRPADRLFRLFVMCGFADRLPFAD